MAEIIHGPAPYLRLEGTFGNQVQPTSQNKAYVGASLSYLWPCEATSTTGTEELR